MRFLVTGATGFVGGRVARRLRERGDAVVTIARDPARAEDLRALGVDVVGGDITDRASLDAPMRGVDGVFHVAGWYKVGARDRTPGQRINVDGTRNVLEAMRAAGVVKGVYTSTLAVHGDTHGARVTEAYRFEGPFESEYDRTKWAAHYQVALPMMRAGLPLVIVQPGLVYGPGDTSRVRTTLIQYLQRGLPPIPAGAAFSWAHVDDIATGHLLAMERGRVGECYHLAGPAWTLLDALKLAERISRVKVPGFVAPPALVRALSAVMGVVERVAPVPELLTSESLRVMAGCTYLGDASKAEQELGWRARPLEDGLRETLAHEMALLGMATPRG